jgi:plastocyanin
MSRTPSFLAALACGTVLALGFAANADVCNSEGKVQIKVKVEDGQPVVDPDTVSACVGDTVHWVFAGPAKQFKVQFMDGDSPFDWSDKKGASVMGTVKADAVKNNEPTPYDYDVEVDGVALDPKIIIEP